MPKRGAKRSPKALSPQQRAAQTRAANKAAREAAQERRRDSARRAAQTRAANRAAAERAAKREAQVKAQRRAASAAKGAQTRAANRAAREAAERAAKRSASAKKGAETKRLAREAIEAKRLRRSASAKKGAATRKAKREGGDVIQSLDDWDDEDVWDESDADWHDYHAGVEYTNKEGSIRVEFYVSVKRPASTNLEAKALQEMVAQWVDSGIEPNGVRIQSIAWDHGRGETHAKRGSQLIDGARENFGRFIHGSAWH